MAKHAREPEELPPVETEYEQWEREARAAAEKAVRDGAATNVGHVVGGDPERFRYDVIDWSPSKSEAILAHRETFHHTLTVQGFRVVEGLKVIGYAHPRVYAMPWSVYHATHGPAKHAKIVEAAKRYPKRVAIVRDQVSPEYRH